MARRVYLYIGLPKTGTTFIQTTMWHNRAQLERQGFLYPGGDRFDHYRALVELRRVGEAAKGPHPYWNELTSRLTAWDGDGLVTHEFFSLVSAAQVERVLADLAPAEVHVVVTTRAYVLQWPAVWQEGLKMFVDASFEEFMAEARARKLTGAWSWSSQDLRLVLRTWARHVPPDRIHVVTVPPPSAPRELLWQRWCAAVGIDDAGFDLEFALPNTSLGAAQAALLLRLKPALSGALQDSSVRHRWVRQYFAHEVLVPQGGDRFGPRPETVDWLRNESRRALRVVRRGGYDVVGEVRELVHREPLPKAHPDDVDTEAMLDVAVKAIDQMIHDVRDLTTERDLLRSQVSRGPRSRLGRLARSGARRVSARLS